MVKTRVIGGEMSQDEINAYVARGRERYPDRTITGVEIEVDGEYVNLTYHFTPRPFERIRRVTGYLVGTLDRWNDAKRAEEADRVKHS